DRQRRVGLACGDRQQGDADRGRSGGAGVDHVVDGDAGLSDLLLQSLAVVRVGLVDVAERQRADGGDVHVGVAQRAQGGFGGQVQQILVGEPAEASHRGPDDPDVTRAHQLSFRTRYPKPIASTPLSSTPATNVSSATGSRGVICSGSVTPSRLALTTPPPSRSTTTEV